MISPRSILVITGPTASGKTGYALKLAEQDPSIEIVNADAFLVYRRLDIGTAKPSHQARAKVRHHLIDIIDPLEEFNAADYSAAARAAIRAIIGRGNTPVVVGGTGLYIDALFNGIMSAYSEDDVLRQARERATEEIERIGFDEMLARLQAIDGDLFAQINRERNPIRLQRAWEHYYATGQPLGVARRLKKPEPFEYRAEFKVLNISRPEIWRRIAQRVDEMLEAGWLAECEALRSDGITREAPGMRAIGYRDLFDVLDGAASLGEARERIIIRTRQYAKRQVTWMKRYEGK